MQNKNIKKAIILAGGSGTRLYPLSKIASKQLQPVYDKPMIYYPLSTLMLAGYDNILLISTPQDLPRFEDLLENGSRLGIHISYKAQEKPEGIAQAFLIGEEFINNDPVCLILGDNIFYGYLNYLREASQSLQKGAAIFGYRVADPKQYGVVEFDDNGNVLSLEEKPKQPKSSFAVPGLYLYDNNVVRYTKQMKPSHRGELEITDLNKIYLNINELTVRILGRGMAWLDTGTPRSLLEASNFVEAIEARQGLKIGCIEEASIRCKYIKTQEQFAKLVEPIPANSYRKYIEEIWEETRNK